MNRTPDEVKTFLELTLLTVERPGRYVGGELNQIVKDWDTIKTKVLLAFPDIYDIGLPNLGLMILYDQINQRCDALAERTYAPWIDMEQNMRRNQIPLFSLESKHQALDFDILAFSLPYETIYTNALNMIDLAEIPLHATQRTDKHPFIIAGGHSVYNPEPMSAFIDIFIIGDGEEIMNDVIDVIAKAKREHLTRLAILSKVAEMDSVYVPLLYHPEYDTEGRYKGLKKNQPGLKENILKNISADLPASPLKPLVPNIDVVHNRIAVEIMRGCSRGCRFCHAGFINRPIRERSIDDIVATIETALDNTGFEEVALLSLSSSDYRNIGKLIDILTEKFKDRNLSISLPSLRIESFSIDLMEKLRGKRSGGFTLAPEAASDHMRGVINKPISEEALLETARAIFENGWTTIKLYFMIGQPNETEEDVVKIADLCNQVIKVGKEVVGGRAKVNVSVSTLIPKPQTPFQWAQMDSPDEIREKQHLIRKNFNYRAIKASFSDTRESWLEGTLSRGDRLIGEVIETAWREGARFDAWRDQYHPEIWEAAFSSCGIDPGDYIYKPREINEIFPWDHISAGVEKNFLKKEYLNSKEGILRADCAENCSNCGILRYFPTERHHNSENPWKCPEIIVKQ
jgi:radical SAM family uncharacterized protein